MLTYNVEGGNIVGIRRAVEIEPACDLDLNECESVGQVGQTQPTIDWLAATLILTWLGHPAAVRVFSLRLDVAITVVMISRRWCQRIACDEGNKSRRVQSVECKVQNGRWARLRAALEEVSLNVTWRAFVG